MNHNKIKAAVIIFVLIITVVVLGAIYFNKKSQEANKQAKPENQENAAIENKVPQEVLDSLMAPTDGNSAPPTKEAIDSLTAPAPAENKTEPTPASDDVLKSLSAPVK